MHLNNIYTELYEIIKSDNIRICLCISQIDHLLYIKKEIINNHGKIYEVLKKEKIKGIPEIYHLYHYDNKLVIIEEYFNMTTLEDYRCNHHLSKKEIRKIMLAVCKIVKRLHHLQVPIIHRDLKLDNLFYDGNEVILLDFDISCFEGNLEQLNGSIGYVAPECYLQYQASKKSDIYSLGIIYYQLLYHTFPDSHMSRSIDDWLIDKMIKEDPNLRVGSTSLICFILWILVHFSFLK